jgi:hypothetical protein
MNFEQCDHGQEFHIPKRRVQVMHQKTLEKNWPKLIGPGTRRVNAIRYGLLSTRRVWIDPDTEVEIIQ